jgi:TetR/AcrR family transcriptional regulator, fatty acid biosynthesis regulator
MKSSDAPSSAPREREAKGKRSLMEAAAHLAAKNGAAQSMSLRELAREAGLTHNAFYRHYDTLEDLIDQLVAEFVEELRTGITEARKRASDPTTITAEVLGWLLDFALSHRDLFVVATRERYGPRPETRKAFEQAMRKLEDDTLRDLRKLHVLPELDDDCLRVGLRLLVEHSLRLCLLHIGAPEQRARRLREAKHAFDIVIAGMRAAAGPALAEPSARHARKQRGRTIGHRS